MRESTIENYLRLSVAKAGGATRKFVSPGRRGVTDQIVIWPCRYLSFGVLCNAPAEIHFIEVKAPRKTARSAQVREHNRLMLLGCVVLVLDTKEKIDNYVEKYK